MHGSCLPSSPPLPPDPGEVASRLAHLPGFVFLDSSGHLPAAPSGDAKALSLIAASPVAFLTGQIEHDLELLDDALREHAPPSARSGDGKAPPLPFPEGALIGSIDYDGSFAFGVYPELLAYSHAASRWHETGGLSGKLAPSPHSGKTVLPSQWTAGTRKKEFLRQVGKAQEYIAAGDIYQVNLSRKFHLTLPPDTPDLFPLYQSLRRACPAPMSAYLRLLPDNSGTPGREILSASPETFLRVFHRQAETRPIKGTRPRHPEDPAADARSARKLLASPKETAELIMITDLLRNDLGQVCEFGSVRTPSLLQHEKLAHVHHLVSTVTGTLRPDITHAALLRAVLPGGSITGAPKKRACQIIRELEPVPRGLYTGVIGYLGFNGLSQFSIAIRTLVREGSELSYHVGAGIVADSEPLAEYHETLHKARGLRKAIHAHSPA